MSLVDLGKFLDYIQTNLRKLNFHILLMKKNYLQKLKIHLQKKINL